MNEKTMTEEQHFEQVITEENICTNLLALSSFIICSVAMLATNPMPGNPSMRIGLFSCGFSVMSIEQTMVSLSLR